MTRLSSAIDTGNLKDADYQFILEGKHCLRDLVDSVGVECPLPYVHVLPPQGEFPCRLKLVMENLFCFSMQKDRRRAGIVVVEEDSEHDGQILRYFPNPARHEYTVSPFVYERLTDDNGRLREVVSAIAYGTRRGVPGEEVGDVQFSIKRARKLRSCQASEPFKVHRIWQTLEDDLVKTWCFLQRTHHFQEFESVVRITNVHPQLDGEYVVYNCDTDDLFTFYGCDLLGKPVESENIYLVREENDGSPDGEVMEVSEVEKEGLYHVLLGERYFGPSEPPSYDSKSDYYDIREAERLPNGTGGSQEESEREMMRVGHPLPPPCNPHSQNGLAEYINLMERTSANAVPGPVVDQNQARGEVRTDMQEASAGVYQYTGVPSVPSVPSSPEQDTSTSIWATVDRPRNVGDDLWASVNTTEDSDNGGGPGGRANMPSSHSGPYSESRMVVKPAPKYPPGLSIPGVQMPLALPAPLPPSPAKEPDIQQETPRTTVSCMDLWNVPIAPSVRSSSPAPSSSTFTNSGPAPIPSPRLSHSQSRSRPRSKTPTSLQPTSSGKLREVSVPRSPRSSSRKFTPPSSPRPGSSTSKAGGVFAEPLPPSFFGSSAKNSTKERSRSKSPHPVRGKEGRASTESGVQNNSRRAERPPEAKDAAPGVKSGDDGGKGIWENVEQVPQNRKLCVRWPPGLERPGVPPQSHHQPEVQVRENVPYRPSVSGTNGGERPDQIPSPQLPPPPLPVIESQKTAPPPRMQPPLPVIKQPEHFEAIPIPEVPKDSPPVSVMGSTGKRKEVPVPGTSPQQMPNAVLPPAGPSTNLWSSIPVPSKPPVVAAASSGVNGTLPVPTTVGVMRSPPVNNGTAGVGLVPSPTPGAAVMPNGTVNVQGGSIPMPVNPERVSVSSGPAPGDSLSIVPRSVHMSQRVDQVMALSLANEGDVGSGPELNTSQQLASMMQDQDQGVMAGLQNVCPDDVALGGLHRPTCSEMALQNAIFQFKGMIERVVRQHIQSVLGIFSANDPTGIKSTQLVIQKIEEKLPESIMQRGDYLYIMPKNLTPVIAGMFGELGVAENFAGGVLMHLFAPLQEMYQGCRVNLLTNTMEQCPSHLYADVTSETIERLQNAPVSVAPRAPIPVPGGIPAAAKLTPSLTPSLMPSLAPSLANQKESVDVPLPHVPPPAPLTVTPTLPVVQHQAAQPVISLQSPPVAQQTPQPEPVPVAPLVFDVAQLSGLSDDHLVRTTVAKLQESQLAAFLKGWLDDCGRDVFLDKLTQLPGCISVPGPAQPHNMSQVNLPASPLLNTGSMGVSGQPDDSGFTFSPVPGASGVPVPATSSQQVSLVPPGLQQSPINLMRTLPTPVVCRPLVDVSQLQMAQLAPRSPLSAVQSQSSLGMNAPVPVQPPGLQVAEQSQALGLQSQIDLNPNAATTSQPSSLSPLGGMISSLQAPIPAPRPPMSQPQIIQPLLNSPQASTANLPDISQIQIADLSTLGPSGALAGAGNSQLLEAMLQVQKMDTMLGRKLKQPKFKNKIHDYIKGQSTSGPLRKYQLDCVEKVERGGNHVFVAPTGSGKTKVFVECARRLLQRAPQAKVVVLCPTVPLVSQQAAVFLVEGFMQQGLTVNAFSGENPLPPCMWSCMLSQHHVMVMTAQILLTVLDEGNGDLGQINMLILDECHHCRGDHPYSKIMDHYKKVAHASKATQVLGFTASPANSSTVEQGCMDLESLLQKMGAELVVIGEENEEVQKYIPTAEEEIVYIESRDEDQLFSLSIGQYLFNACSVFLQHIIPNITAVPEIPPQALIELRSGQHSSVFENWAKTAGETFMTLPEWPASQKQEFQSSCELLRTCNISLNLVREAGFEAAMRHISKKTSELTPNLSVQNAEAKDTSMYRTLLAGLFNTAPVKNISMVAQAFKMTSNPGDYRSFPRFVALVKFLEQYKLRQSFHGMIFCRTREAVYSLTEMLRTTPTLYFLTAMELIGHGKTARKSAGRSSLIEGTFANVANRGMTGSQQRDVLERFKMPGKHVLVCTSAGEEGINVTVCEFVVRYSVTETGIERVQSKGRTRVRNGKFVNIVEKDGKDGKLFLKSVKQEAAMNQVVKLYGGAARI